MFLAHSELAVGNIVRKVLRLIREEYRAACLAQLENDGLLSPTSRECENDSVPGTPMPPTPGINVPTTHWLSNDYNRSTPTKPSFVSTASHQRDQTSSPVSRNQSPQPRPAPTQLSNFVQMRHTRVQLERAGSTANLVGLENSFMPTTSPSSPGNDSGSLNRRTSFPGLSALAEALPQRGAQRDMTPKQIAKLREQKAMQMKPVLVDAIREVVDEIETTHETCAKGAKEHIHSSQVLTSIICHPNVVLMLCIHLQRDHPDGWLFKNGGDLSQERLQGPQLYRDMRRKLSIVSLFPSFFPFSSTQRLICMLSYFIKTSWSHHGKSSRSTQDSNRTRPRFVHLRPHAPGHQGHPRCPFGSRQRRFVHDRRISPCRHGRSSPIDTRRCGGRAIQVCENVEHVQ